MAGEDVVALLVVVVIFSLVAFDDIIIDVVGFRGFVYPWKVDGSVGGVHGHPWKTGEIIGYCGWGGCYIDWGYGL